MNSPKTFTKRNGFVPLRHVWAVTASLLPASLYEEVRCVATPIALSQHVSNQDGLAMSVAHIYFIELLMAVGVARLCSRQEALNCGRLLLVAGWLNLAGLMAMALSNFGGVELYVCGHMTYSLGTMVRDVVFPALTSCFPAQDMNQLLAFKRMFVHVGALIGGALIAMNMLRCYLLVLAMGMGLSLAMLSRVLPYLEAFDNVAHPRTKQTPAFTGFWMLIVARFFTSMGLVSTSGVVLLKLFTTRAPFGYDQYQFASKSIAAHSVIGHVAGILVNLMLGWLKISYGIRDLLFATMTCVVCTCSYPVVASVPQYLVATFIYRAARTLAKAASDAIALQCAKDLDSRKSAALLSRRVAFKVGQLVGKYCIAPLLALPDADFSLYLIFGGGAAMSILGALLHIPACVQHERHALLPYTWRHGIVAVNLPRAVAYLCQGSVSKTNLVRLE